MKVIKRDGHMVDFTPEKIEQAILKANAEVSEEEQVSNVQIKNIIKYIEKLDKKRILVEDIQDIIEEKLMNMGKYKLAKKYITYRYTRELVRKSNTTDLAIRELIDGESNYFDSSKDAKLITSQKDYLASITSTDIAKRFLIPEDIVKAHDEGTIYINDIEYFAYNAMHDSSIINLEDILENEIVINDNKIAKPSSFLETILITTEIIIEVLKNQYGKCLISLNPLLKFIKNNNEIKEAVKIFNYQMNLIDKEKLKIYINSNDKNKHLNSLIKELQKQNDISINITDKDLSYGSFNQGTITINLLDLSLSSEKNINNFWNLLDERLELCHRALQIKHKRLSKVTSDVSPIIWQNGALARLDKEESLHNLLHSKYSAITLGYIGLDESVKYMSENEDLETKIIKYMNDKCKKWKEEEKLNYIIEIIDDKKTTEKIVQNLKLKFGNTKLITEYEMNHNRKYNNDN